MNPDQPLVDEQGWPPILDATLHFFGKHPNKIHGVDSSAVDILVIGGQLQLGFVS